MAIAFRADAETTNSTAATTIVINKPTGTLDGDILIAFIADTSDGGGNTGPSGWTRFSPSLAQIDTPGSGLLISAWWKVASSEPSSWTWTFGPSVKRVGTVLAFSGGHQTNPIASYANDVANTIDIPIPVQGIGVACVGFVTSGATLSGIATTGTQRADLCTNAVSGREVGLASSSSVVNTGNTPTTYRPSFTYSGALLFRGIAAVTLNAAFTGYSGGLVEPIVEAAFGANPDDDDPASNWVFTDISGDVLKAPQVVIAEGRSDEQGSASPCRISFTLRNINGDYTPGNPSGANWPDVKLSLPIRVSVPYGYGGSTELVTAFVESLIPSWDASLNLATVQVECIGRLSRLRSGDALQSLMRRSISNVNSSVSDALPHDYWPMEDGSDAMQAASALTGRKPLRGNANVRFGADDSLAGSASLPTISTGGKLTGPIKSYANTGEWSVVMAFKLDTPVGQRISLLDIYTNGRARRWQITLGPGSPDVLGVVAKAPDSTGASVNVLDDDVAITESEFYGKWVLLYLCVDQIGADIDYVVGFYNGSFGNSASGVLSNYDHGVGQSVMIDGVATLDGASVGHLAFYNSSSFDQIFDPIAIADSLSGQIGEGPATRFNRLVGEEGVPSELQNSANGETMDMGPQSLATLETLFQEVEAADQGLIHDGGTLGALVFNTRGSRYNAPVAMTLDLASGEVALDFQPTYDTQRVRNDSTVSVVDGSSARYIGDTSEGVFKDSVSLSLENATHAYAMAGWRVHLGKPGMRYPVVSFNLRRNPHLAQTWLFTPIGSRIRITGLPDEHGSDSVDLFIEGYTEVLSQDTWIVRLNCSPAKPYDVATVETPTSTAWRLESGATTLAGAENTTDTTISVNVTGALWTTTDVPFSILVNGEEMLVNSVSGASSPQTFTVTRSVNGVVKSHSSGAAVTLCDPRPLAL